MKSLSLQKMSAVEGGQRLSAAERRRLCNYAIRLAAYYYSVGNLDGYFQALDMQWFYCGFEGGLP